MGATYGGYLIAYFNYMMGAIVVRLYLKLNRSPKACVALLLLLLCHNFASYYKAILIHNSVNVLHSRVDIAHQM